MDTADPDARLQKGFQLPRAPPPDPASNAAPSTSRGGVRCAGLTALRRPDRARAHAAGPEILRPGRPEQVAEPAVRNLLPVRVRLPGVGGAGVPAPRAPLGRRLAFSRATCGLPVPLLVSRHAGPVRPRAWSAAGSRRCQGSCLRVWAALKAWCASSRAHVDSGRGMSCLLCPVVSSSAVWSSMKSCAPPETCEK